jgi:MSHA biogenesis protein MshJ
MKEIYEKYRLIYEQRVFRERLIIAAVVVVLIYFLFDLLMFQPIAKKRSDLDQRMANANSTLDVVKIENDALVRALSNGPDLVISREIEQLEEKVVDLNNTIASLSDAIIPAEKLPLVIQEILSYDNKLELLHLTLNKPKELQFEGVDSMEDENRNVGVYKHTVSFVVRGEFFDVQRYLKNLESSEWHFYWDSIEYQVEGYPLGLAHIEAYTLSTNRGFIGE